jgi:hypothetical protein
VSCVARSLASPETDCKLLGAAKCPPHASRSMTIGRALPKLTNGNMHRSTNSMRCLVASAILLTVSSLLFVVLSPPGYSGDKVSWRRSGNFNTLQSPNRQKKPNSVIRQTVPVAGPARCKWAQSIVSDYAFENVKARSCEGSFYIFEGTREGKVFTIHLSSSGELLKVERFQPNYNREN